MFRPGHRPTDAEAANVVERPVSTLDFWGTVCRLLGINYEKQNTTLIGRPVRIVDRGANPAPEPTRPWLVIPREDDWVKQGCQGI